MFTNGNIAHRIFERRVRAQPPHGALMNRRLYENCLPIKIFSNIPELSYRYIMFKFTDNGKYLICSKTTTDTYHMLSTRVMAVRKIRFHLIRLSDDQEINRIDFDNDFKGFERWFIDYNGNTICYYAIIHPVYLSIMLLSTLFVVRYLWLGTASQITDMVQRKPARGETTLSVSCSDKIARWDVLGVQGVFF